MPKPTPLDTHNHRKEDLPKIETSLNLIKEKWSLLDTEKHNLAELKEKLENFKRDLPALKEDFSKISLNEKGKQAEAERNKIYKGITKLKHDVDALLKDVLSLSVDISALEAAQSEARSGAESEVVPPVVKTAAENLPAAGEEFLYGNEKIKFLRVENGKVVFLGEDGEDSMSIENWSRGIKENRITLQALVQDISVPENESEGAGSDAPAASGETEKTFEEKRQILRKYLEGKIPKAKRDLTKKGDLEIKPKNDRFISEEKYISQLSKVDAVQAKAGITLDDMKTVYRELFAEWKAELKAERDALKPVRTKLVETPASGSAPADLPVPAGEGPLEGVGSFIADGSPDASVEIVEIPHVPDGEPAGSSVIRAVNVDSILGGENTEGEGETPETPEEKKNKVIDAWLSRGDVSEFGWIKFNGKEFEIAEFLYNLSKTERSEQIFLDAGVTTRDILDRIDFLARNVWWKDKNPKDLDFVLSTDAEKRISASLKPFEAEAADPEREKTERMRAWLTEKGFIPGENITIQNGKYVVDIPSMNEQVPLKTFLKSIENKKWFRKELNELEEIGVSSRDLIECMFLKSGWDKKVLKKTLSRQGFARIESLLEDAPAAAEESGEDAPDSLEISAEQKKTFIRDWLKENDFVPGKSSKLVDNTRGYSIIDEKIGSQLTLARFLDQFAALYQKEMMSLSTIGIGSEAILREWFTLESWDRKKLENSLQGTRWESLLSDVALHDDDSDVDEESYEMVRLGTFESREYLNRFLFDGKPLKVGDVLSFDLRDGLNRFVLVVDGIVESRKDKNVYLLKMKSEDTGRVRYFTPEKWVQWTRAFSGQRDIIDADFDEIGGPGESANSLRRLEYTPPSRAEFEKMAQDFAFEGKPVACGDKFLFDPKDGKAPLEIVIEEFVIRESKMFLKLKSGASNESRFVEVERWQRWVDNGLLTKVDTSDRTVADDSLGEEETVHVDVDVLPFENFEFDGEPVTEGDKFLFDPKDGIAPLEIVIGEFVIRESKAFLKVRSLDSGKNRLVDIERWQRWVDNGLLTKIDTSSDTRVIDPGLEDTIDSDVVDDEITELDSEEMEDVIEFGGREFMAGDELFLVIPRLPVQKVTVLNFDEDTQELLVRNEKGRVLRIREEYLEFLKDDLDTDKTGVFRPLDRRQLPPELPVERPALSKESEPNLPLIERLKQGLGAENLKNYYTKFASGSAESAAANKAIVDFIKNLPESKFSPEKKQQMYEAIHTALGSMFAGAHKRYLHLHEHYDETEAPIEEAPPTPETFAGRLWGKAMDIGKSIKRQAKSILLSGAAAAGAGAGTGLGVSAAVTTVSGIGATGAMVAAFAPVFMAGAGAVAAKGVWDYLKRDKWQETKEKRMNVSAQEQKKIEEDTWKRFEANESSLAADRVALTIEAALAGITDPTEIQQYVYDGLIAKIERKVQSDPSSAEARGNVQSVKLEKKSWERDQLISPELAYTALAQNFTNRSDFFTHNWGLLGKGYESVAGGDFGTLSENKQKALAGGFLSSIVAGTSAMVVVMTGGGFGSKLLGRAATGFGFGTLRGMAGHKSENIISESKRMREADVRLHRGDQNQKQNLDYRIDNIQLNHKNRAADSLSKGLLGAALGVGVGSAADWGAEKVFGHRGSFENGTEITHGPSTVVHTEALPQPEVLAPAVHFAPGETINIGGHEFHIGPQQQLVELPKVLSMDSEGNTLLGTTTIVSHSGAEWGALDRLSDQYGNFGMTKGQEAAWIKDELAQYGFVFRGGNVGRPWEVHPGMKVEVFVDKAGHPHIKFLGQEGKDFTAFKFLKFQEPAKVTHTETTIIPPATPEKMPVSVKEVYDGIYNGKINVPESTHVEMHKVAALPEVHTEMVSGPGAAHETYLGREGGKSYVYIKQPDGAFIRSSYDDFFKVIPNANKVSHLPGDMHSDLRGIEREQAEHIADKARLTPELPPKATVETKQVTTLDPTKKVWVSSHTPVRAGSVVEEKSSFVPVQEVSNILRTREVQSYAEMSQELKKVVPLGPGAEEKWDRLSGIAERHLADKNFNIRSMRDIEDRILIAAVDERTKLAVGNPPSHCMKIFKDGETYFLRDDEAVFSKNARNEPVMIFHNPDGTDSSYVVKDFHPQMDLSVQYIVEVDGVLRSINPRAPLAS